MQVKLITLDGFTEMVFQSKPALRHFRHFSREISEGIAAAVLCVVHGQVGIFQQFLCGIAVFGKNGDANAGGYEQFLLVDVERFRQAQPYAFGNGCGIIVTPYCR